jgi:hypothetical protein
MCGYGVCMCFDLYSKNIWFRVRIIWLQMGSYYPFRYLGLHNKDHKR